MSTITAVELVEVAFPTRDLGRNPHGSATYLPGTRAEAKRWQVVIETDEGARGTYVSTSPGTGLAIGQTLDLAPILIGRDPLQREAIFQECAQRHRATDHVGYGILDIGLWDLAGKQLDTSVADLLGRYHDRLPAYASTMHGDAEPDGLSAPGAYVEFAEQCSDQGYRAFKAHPIDADPVGQSGIVGALAGGLGDRMDLMLDSSSELRTMAHALAVGRACDEAGFFWFEDPLIGGGVSAYAHRKLRQALRTPLLIGEHLRGISPKADLLAAEATDFLRADPDLDLGITGVMRIAHLAEAFGVDVELHTAGPPHRQCMAAIRNTNYYELGLVHPRLGNPRCPDALYADGYSDQLEAVDADGCVPVPDGPGLGVTYDEEFLDRHRTGVVHRFTAAG